jgi:hypothetical protein
VLALIFFAVGIGTGCLVGWFSTHHFPVYGGIMMMSQPYSKARWDLLPGHMLIWSLALGFGFAFVGFCVGSAFKLFLKD